MGDLYDRYRPHYPESLFSDLLSLADIGPGSRILEIGSGTGIATIPVARRGFSIVCLEPGAQLATLLRGKLAKLPRSTVLETTFEAWNGDASAFDLVYSAQAFHWLDPGVRCHKVASVLKPRGWLAVFGHCMSLTQQPVRNALDDTYSRLAPTVDSLSRTAWYAHDGPIPALFAESGFFESTHVLRHPWQATHQTSDYVNFLRTTSGHQMLPESQREELLDEVARAVDRFGGQIEVACESNLFMARLLARRAP